MPACATDGCTKAGTMACPACEKLGVCTVFCDQQCFTASWAHHKSTHKALKHSAKKSQRAGAPSVAPTRKVMALYGKAMDALNQADSKPGAELEAQKLLSRAIKMLTPGEVAGQKRKRLDSQMSELLTQMHFILGRIVEAQDPAAALQSYTSAHRISSESAEVNLHLARLRWKCAFEQQHMTTVEARLKDAVRLSRMQGDEETERDANELLARLYCQQAKSGEAHQILAKLGYTHAFAGSLSAARAPAEPKRALHGSKLAAAEGAAAAVNAFDGALPEDMLRAMKAALGPSAPYWAENAYNSPRTGFFSFQHRLPPFPPTKAAACGIDQMLQRIWQVAASAVPAVKKARYVEWWAHTRPHFTGHQIHFDSVPGKVSGKPRHPIISTITFLTADCGGGTLITDQTIDNKTTTKGWLAEPRANRLVTFDGSLLHCVLPGAGPAPAAEARRTTFMAAFWEQDPGRTTFNSVDEASSNGASDLVWPQSFHFEESLSAESQLGRADLERSKEAVTPLGTDEIWEVVGVNSKDQQGKKQQAGLDMMNSKIFTLSAGLLELGIRPNAAASEY